MKNKSNKSQFNVGHFPTGTVCEVQVTRSEPKIVTVTGVAKNGPTSYIITTDTPGTVTEFFSCNIAWVTRILKRGPGVARLDRSAELKYTKVNFDRAYAEQAALGIRKPKSKYLTLDRRSLVYCIAIQYARDDMLIDLDKLLMIIENRGLFQRMPVPEGNDLHWAYNHIILASKKKLRRTIKQVVNKCLRNHVKEQRAEDAEYQRAAERDMFDSLDEDFSYALYYDTTNEKGFPQTMQRDPAGDFPVCSSCHEMVEVNVGRGTDCNSCQDSALNEMSHDY